MIRWIFFSTLAMGIFYALYCLLLKRDRWLMLSRWYLLITLVFSLLVPLVRMPASVTDNSDDLLTVVSIELPAVVAASSDVVVQRAEICRWIYLTGLIVMVTILLVRLWRLLSYLREQTFVKCGELRLSLTEDNMPPFSFFKWVVVGTQGLSSEEMECVLAHEELHVRQCHSADILLVRALCCLAWFNPLAWVMLRELQSVHEYLADNAVMQHHGGKGYLGLLYREATGYGYGHITNNFQSINIKKRITMMSKKRSRFGAWKMVAALPVAAWLLLVGCQPAVAQSADPVSKKQAVKSEQKVSMTPQQVNAKVQQDNSSKPGGVAEPAKLKTTATPEQTAQQEKQGPDVEPQFPGGVEALRQYLADNIKYPEKAKKDGVQGKVFVRFTIDADGSIYNVEVARGIGSGCDEEAVRVVKTMPKWSPAIDDGKPVAVSYVIPIIFLLQE